MKAKYVYRIDDVCENMRWDKFFKVMKLFDKYSVVPLLGVIPDNRDLELLKYPCFKGDFWFYLKTLSEHNKIEICLHGYTHQYITNDSGILKINKRSEFSGISKKEQCFKVKEGKNILLSRGLKPIAFMAPAHSFDKYTIECLKNNNIKSITDGYGRFPYTYEGVTFIPQMYARPRRKSKGIYTWCLHTNTMSDDDIKNLELFLSENYRDTIKFSEAENFKKENSYFRIERYFIGSALIVFRFIKRNIRKLIK